MFLALDVGNTHIVGGLIDEAQVVLRFRHATADNLTSDQLGLFLQRVLEENGYSYHQVDGVAIGSVVPPLDYSLRSAIKRYFKITPFVIRGGVKTGVDFCIDHPEECGADIVAGVAAAVELYPQRGLLVIDLGTATTITVVTKDCRCLGAVFIPGVRTALESLAQRTAKLFPVEAVVPQRMLGKNTREALQSGVYLGQIGAIKEIIRRTIAEVFPEESPLIVATGGFAGFFADEKVFDHIEPDLVLQGIRRIYQLNQNE